MTLDQFIRDYKVKPADAIVVKKDFIGLLDHYLIYLGYYSGEHKFIANYLRGTKILSYAELNSFSREFSPSRIRKFKGNDIQRNAAVERALSRCDQYSYHLILNNCEHFANYVQEGKPFSKQTTVFGAGLAVTGLAMAASSKNDANKSIGVLMAALGLLTLFQDSKD